MTEKIIIILTIIQLGFSPSMEIQFTSNSFASCLKHEKPNILTCAGQQAIEALQQLNSASNFTLIDGVVFSKDENVMGRNAPVNFLDNDPNDFR